MSNKILSIKEIVGENYDEFWNFKGRYKCVKGGRGSKKSSTTALYYIYMMWAYWHVYRIPINVLVIRKFFRTMQDSCFNQLLWAIEELGLQNEFDTLRSPLKMVFKPSGGEIIFRGLDDPLKLTSVKPAVGFLCWAWLEEAYEVSKVEDFNKVDMSLRGILPKELFYQWTIIFNPWNSSTWIKGRFFDKVDTETGISEDEQIMAITRNYYHNEFLDDAYLEIFKRMKIENPRRYEVEGKGEWGTATGNIFENNWEILDFDPERISNYFVDGYRYKKRAAIDFGFADPTAFVILLTNEHTREIYVCYEFCKSKVTNDEIAEMIKSHCSKNQKIVADCADPRSINELQIKGINIVPSKKGRDSILAGIQKLQEYHIFIHPSCKCTIEEFSNYHWDVNKDGKEMNKPADEWNHCIDAIRYACEELANPAIYW